MFAGAGVGSVVSIVVRPGSPGASITCQVCACVVVSLLLLGRWLSVARPDFVLLSRPRSGHDRVFAKGQPGPCADVWRKGDVADVWSCPGRVAWSRRRVRARVIRRVVLLAQLLLPRFAFVVAGSVRFCRMCSVCVGVMFDGVRVFVRFSVIGVC